MQNLDFYQELLTKFENRKLNSASAEYIQESIEMVVREMAEIAA